MILQKLTLKNYKQYIDFELEFKEGLVGIIGKNGSGKSTLFDAVVYCLFGSDTTNVGKEYIKNSSVDAAQSVALTLEFEMNAKYYKVHREIRGKNSSVSADLYENGVQIATKTADVTKVIEKILSTDLKSFKKSVFSGQKELSQLSDETGKIRRDMIAKMLGLDTIDQCEKKVKEDLKILKNQIEGQEKLLLTEEKYQENSEGIAALQANIGTMTTQKQATETQLNDQKQAIAALKTQETAEREKQTKIQEKEKLLIQYTTRIKSLEEQCTQINGKINEIEGEKIGYENEKIKLEGFEKAELQLKIFEKNRKLFDTKNILQTQLDAQNASILTTKQAQNKLENELKNCENIDETLRNINEKTAATQKIIDDITVKIKDTEAQINQLKGNIADRKTRLEKLEKLGDAADCPTCMQPLAQAYQQTLEALTTEITGYETEINQKFQQKFDALQQELSIQNQLQTTQHAQQKEGVLQQNTRQNLLQQTQTTTAAIAQQTQKINDLTAQITAIETTNYDKATHEKYATKIENYRPTYNAFMIIKNKILNELPAAITQKNNIETNIAKGKQLIEKTEQEKNNINYNTQHHAALTQQITTNEAAKETTQTTYNQQVMELNGTEKQLQSIQNELKNHDKIKNAIAGTQAEMLLLEKLTKHFAEFKNYILNQLSPMIATEASRLFNIITKGKYESININSDFEFEIYDKGVAQPLKRFSGGEIDLANICLRIALTKAMAQLKNNAQTVSFLAFDEIFGSQDDERREEILTAFNHLKEEFRQIYIISHIDFVKQFFPNILEISINEKGSQAHWIN